MIRIPLTQGYEALIDDQDVALAKLNWYAQIGTGGAVYARRNTRTKAGRSFEFLHWAVLGRRVCVDHIDGDGLNCRRKNLRPAGRAENNANAKLRKDNTAGYKGVCWGGQRGWIARVQVSGKRRHVGTFPNPIEAAKAYDAAARAAFGEFACLNFPRQGERGCHA